MTASPFLPARPARPQRCRKAFGSLGGSLSKMLDYVRLGPFENYIENFTVEPPNRQKKCPAREQLHQSLLEMLA